MSPPDPDQSAQKPAFSWESVVARDDATDDSGTDDLDASALAPISLTIAPLSLEPLPPVPESPTRAETTGETPPVLGDLHVGLSLGESKTAGPAVPPPADPQVADPVPPAADVAAAPVVPPVPAPAPAPAPLPATDDPGPTPAVATGSPSAASTASDPAPAAGAPVLQPTISETGGGIVPRPPAVPVPEVPTDDAADQTESDVDDAETGAAEATAADPDGEEPAGEVRISPLDVPDSSPTGSTPTVGAVSGPHSGDVTTVVPTVSNAQGFSPALPGVAPAASPNPTAHQPNQAAGARLHHSAAAVAPAPATLTRKARKKQQKQQQQQLKAARKRSSSGRGGFALFFTLLVLVGLIVAAVIFGRPYLFPDDWDAASKPYGDAVEAVSGEPLAEAVVVTRHAPATYAIAMTDELLEGWDEQVPMWRSFGLVDGAVDTPVLREVLEGWTPAFYSPSTGEIVANDALTPAAVDGAIVAAMAAADLDQRTGWSTVLADASLDSSAFTRAQVIRSATDVAAASSFGAPVSERRPDKAEFLPPILSYRVNAPYVFAEVVPEGELTEVDSITVLPLSREPELVGGETIIEAQQQMDRGFWYIVFASYTDATAAYAASNAIVEASLATVDRAGTTCSYGTFSGSDVAGTERLAGVLAQWVASVPAEMTASTTALADGTLQLTSCDPGAAVSTGARFGTASELARWRLVELVAIEAVDPATGTAADRTAAVVQVRQSQVASALMSLPFDTTPLDLATAARQLVEPAAVLPAEATQPDETAAPAD